MQGRGFNSFASNMIKLSVNETKWSSLLARTRALILYISIWKFDFGPEKLPGLSRNGPQVKFSKFHFSCWIFSIFFRISRSNGKNENPKRDVSAWSQRFEIRFRISRSIANPKSGLQNLNPDFPIERALVVSQNSPYHGFRRHLDE